MMTDDDDFKRRARLHQYLKLFASMLGIVILALVLFIVLKQAQVMNDVSDMMRQTMQTVSDNIENAEADSHSDDPYSEY